MCLRHKDATCVAADARQVKLLMPAFASFFVDSCESFEFKMFRCGRFPNGGLFLISSSGSLRVRNRFKTAICGLHTKVEEERVMHVTPNMTCHVAALDSGLLRLLSVLICSFGCGFLHVESSSVFTAVSQGRNPLLVLESVHILAPNDPQVDQSLQTHAAQPNRVQTHGTFSKFPNISNMSQRILGKCV